MLSPRIRNTSEDIKSDILFLKDFLSFRQTTENPDFIEVKKDNGGIPDKFYFNKKT
jgi:hypothetical protein